MISINVARTILYLNEREISLPPWSGRHTPMGTTTQHSKTREMAWGFLFRVLMMLREKTKEKNQHGGNT